MQHAMKVNGKVDVQSMICQLTPEEHMCQVIPKKKYAVLTSMIDCWGKSTAINNLGPDILNRTPGPTNYDPWEDEDEPLFFKLDDKDTPAKEAEDTLSTQKCFSSLETFMSS